MTRKRKKRLDLLVHGLWQGNPYISFKKKGPTFLYFLKNFYIKSKSIAKLNIKFAIIKAFFVVAFGQPFNGKYNFNLQPNVLIHSAKHSIRSSLINYEDKYVKIQQLFN